MADRTRDPEATWEWIRPHFASCGITRVANITGLDVIGLPVVSVVRPNTRSLAVSQGKGLTLIAAKVSGAMEAIEMHHAENIALPLRYTSFADLRRAARVADVARLPKSAAGRFHPQRKLHWIEGRNLIGGESLFVPSELVHTDFTLPLPAGSGAFVGGSNGLASGNHLFEAVCHAICEVVERDARTLWSLGDPAARDRSRIDLATVGDEACLSVIQQMDRAGVSVAVWEITSDLGVAAFQCTVWDREPSPLRPVLAASGTGCHPDRAVALLRALTEAVQSRLTIISGARDDWTQSVYRANQDRDRLREQIAVHGSQAPRAFSEVPDRKTERVDSDVVWLLERLHAAGIREAIVVDLTRAEIGIPVARVVIPGMEGIGDAPGYTPGERGRRILGARDR